MRKGKPKSQDNEISNTARQSTENKEIKEEISIVDEESTNEKGTIEFEVTSRKEDKNHISNQEAEKDVVPFEIIESDQHTTT